MMRYLSNIIFILFFSLAACNRYSIDNRVSSADGFARANGFEKKIIESQGFNLTIFSKINNSTKPINIYLEGDGLAFLNRYTISDNPTPSKLMLLKLAALDKRDNVVYLARPCQYTSLNLNPQCRNNKYWTSDRFSEESISAINNAINKISLGKPVNLIGFSGGGGISVLIAARNKNVKSIVTLAGNLNHVAFNNYHKVTAMHNSLNPIDYAHMIINIPQLHLAGANDKIVPPFISEGFIEKSKSPCVKGEVVSGASHDSGWERIWPIVTMRKLTCN